MKPVCLITGSGGYLGNALCRQLSARFDIVAVYRNLVPQCNSQIIKRIEPNSYPESYETSPIFCIQGDLASREDIRRIVEVAIAKFERVDHIINAAADIKFHGNLKELWQSDNYYSNQMYVNCIAPMLLVSAVYDACWKDSLLENKKWNRSVINVSSISGLQAFAPIGQAFYAASKSALNMLTLYLSSELNPYFIRTNAICPGAFYEIESCAKVVAEIENLLYNRISGTLINIL